MRPQGFGQMGMGLEDLGWNDMGHAQQGFGHVAVDPEPLPEHVPSSISALTPAPRLGGPAQPVENRQPIAVPDMVSAPPPVVEQQRAVVAAFAEKRPAPPRQARGPAKGVWEHVAPRTKGKAAFTLRLDADRHLKLRLACAVTHRSAQQIVTEALDEFLGALPELDAMASQVATKAGGKRN
jgi:hypothetical protein